MTSNKINNITIRTLPTGGPSFDVTNDMHTSRDCELHV